MKYKIGDVVDYIIESNVICTCVIIKIRDNVFDGYYRVESEDGDIFTIYTHEMRLNKSYIRRNRIENLL